MLQHRLGPLHMGVHGASFLHTFGFFLGSVGTWLLTGPPLTMVLGYRERQYLTSAPFFFPHGDMMRLSQNHKTAWGKSLGTVEPSLIPSPGTHTLGSPFGPMRVWSWILPEWPPPGYVTGGATRKETWSVRGLRVRNTWVWWPRGSNSLPLSRKQRGGYTTEASHVPICTRVSRCLGQTRFTKIQFFWHMVMRKLFPSYLIIKVFLVSGFIWGRLSDL